MLTADGAGLRAEDIRLAWASAPQPKDVEGIRAKLKRLVNREIVTDSQPKPDLFTLNPKRT